MNREIILFSAGWIAASSGFLTALQNWGLTGLYIGIAAEITASFLFSACHHQRCKRKKEERAALQMQIDAVVQQFQSQFCAASQTLSEQLNAVNSKLNVLSDLKCTLSQTSSAVCDMASKQIPLSQLEVLQNRSLEQQEQWYAALSSLLSATSHKLDPVSNIEEITIHMNTSIAEISKKQLTEDQLKNEIVFLQNHLDDCVTLLDNTLNAIPESVSEQREPLEEIRDYLDNISENSNKQPREDTLRKLAEFYVDELRESLDNSFDRLDQKTDRFIHTMTAFQQLSEMDTQLIQELMDK